MDDIIVPITICAILPIAIVLISALTKINRDNKRSEVLMKAIEANKDVNTDQLIRSLEKSGRSGKSEIDLLNLRLLRGCIASLLGIASLICGLFDRETSVGRMCFFFAAWMLAIGIGYLIVYFVTRNQVGNSENR